jgi:methionine synthase II (cobalamin-independent)
MNFKAQCRATGIGSFPHRTAAAACEVIRRNLPEVPFWPQLPAMDFREQMDIQYTEGLPRVVLDEARQRVSLDTSGDPTAELERFYESVMTESLDAFAISPVYSRGIPEMERLLETKAFPAARYFKNQVTGPVTVGLGMVDENKRAIFYNDVFRDVVVKAVTMKARWLLSRFRRFGITQICFVDEPILSAFGSSTYVSVQREDVVGAIREVVEALHAEGAIVGTHCCGNTEWPILVDAGIDIISFDAFEFGDTIRYYPERIKGFLEAGGTLAWGIVPTSEKIAAETPDSLYVRLNDKVRNLAAKGIDEGLIWTNCLVTPSCGTGSLSVELAEKVFRDLAEVSRRLRESHGFEGGSL